MVLDISVKGLTQFQILYSKLKICISIKETDNYSFLEITK